MQTPSTGQRKRRPRIVVLATGGTIAGAAPTDTDPGYTSGRVRVDDMLGALPQLQSRARVRGIQVANVGSQDMTIGIMIELAGRINDLLDADEADGIVVTHGTDTMEETAYFLNLTVKSRRPVVMTGAMRPYTAISADGPLNLYNAVAVAADAEAAGRGTLVVMNDRIHGAHSLTKSNTTAVETFISPINGLIGTVNYGQAEYFRRPVRRHTHRSGFTVAGASVLPRVDIIYACADMPPDLVDGSVARDARGIVIAGDGNGNMSSAAVERAAAAAKQGVVIVRSSRVATGKVSRNVEIDDDRHGFVAADELNPPKARILLMLALQKKRSIGQIQKLFLTY